MRGKRHVKTMVKCRGEKNEKVLILCRLEYHFHSFTISSESVLFCFVLFSMQGLFEAWRCSCEQTGQFQLSGNLNSLEWDQKQRSIPKKEEKRGKEYSMTETIITGWSRCGSLKGDWAEWTWWEVHQQKTLTKRLFKSLWKDSLHYWRKIEFYITF